MERLIAALTAIAFLLPTPALSQVPPPPSLPGQDVVGRDLVTVFARKDVAGYSALLSPDVHVYDDGTLVARSRGEWMRRFGPELAAAGVIFCLSPGYSSTGRLLFIEYFNSMASWGRTPPPDCCWGYRAVAYDIGDGKIMKIQQLNGGAVRLDDKGSPASH